MFEWVAPASFLSNFLSHYDDIAKMNGWHRLISTNSSSGCVELAASFVDRRKVIQLPATSQFLVTNAAQKNPWWSPHETSGLAKSNRLEKYGRMAGTFIVFYNHVFGRLGPIEKHVHLSLKPSRLFNSAILIDFATRQFWNFLVKPKPQPWKLQPHPLLFAPNAPSIYVWWILIGTWCQMMILGQCWGCPVPKAFQLRR